MKKTYLLSILVMLFSMTSCWDSDYQEDFDELRMKATESEDSGGVSMSCDNPSSIKSPYHCLTNQAGGITVFKYGESGIVGTWRDNSNLCLTFNANGTGTYRYKNNNGSVGSFPIKWGIMVDSNGKPIVDNSGQAWYLFMEGSQVDPQIAIMPYKFSTKELLGFDFVKGSCNF